MQLTGMSVESGTMLPQLARAVLFTENMVTRFQSWLERDNSGLTPAIKSHVATAKDLKVSLLDNARESAVWWNTLYELMGIPKEQRGTVTRKLYQEIRPRIGGQEQKRIVPPRVGTPKRNRPGEAAIAQDPEAAEYQKLTATRDSEGMPEDTLAIGLVILEENHQKLKKLSESGLKRWISNSLDYLDPDKREMIKKKTDTEDNNLRIAQISIQLLAKWGIGDMHEEPVDAEIIGEVNRSRF